MVLNFFELSYCLSSSFWFSSFFFFFFLSLEEEEAFQTLCALQHHGLPIPWATFSAPSSFTGIQEKLVSGTKSVLLECLSSMPKPGCSKAAKEASVIVLDVTTVIHITKSQHARLFREYTQMHLIPFLESHLTSNMT